MPWSSEEFIYQAAKQAKHPHNLIEGVPVDIKKCIRHRSSDTSESIALERTSIMRRWMMDLVECMDEEKAYKEGMSLHRVKVLASKRLVSVVPSNVGRS